MGLDGGVKRSSYLEKVRLFEPSKHFSSFFVTVESNGCVVKIQASLYVETNHATFKKNSQVMRHVLVSFGSVYGAD